MVEQHKKMGQGKRKNMTYKLDLLKTIVSDIFKSYIGDNYNLKNLSKVDMEQIYELFKYHRLETILNDELLLAGETKNVSRNITINQQNHERKIEGYDCIAKLISEEFKKENISFVFLKGYSLYLSLYKKTAHRYFNDLDILISDADISKTILVLKKLGFCYGRVRNGKLIEANREDIIYQKLNTHELHNMVLERNGQFFNLDINFLFSWKGIKNELETMREIPFCEVEKNIVYIKKGKYLLPILNCEYQFLHLCSHFYNESVFFALNRSYIQGDPKEVILVRLLDIVLLLNSSLNLDKVKEVCDEYDFKYKIQFVLNILIEFDDQLVSKNVIQKFDLQNCQKRNYYYVNNKNKIEWKIDVVTRMLLPQYKVAEILDAQINEEWK